jgi:GNAT superfamily N-acetyltransferase
MTSLSIRHLGPDELVRFDEIDRTETITHIWYMREGRMVLEEEHWDLTDWAPQDKPEILRKLQACLENGGAAWGAFDDDRLVAIAALDGRWYGRADDTLDMYFLHVSNGYRHQGIGRTLFNRARDMAMEMGAKRLFVSGLPSLNTIRFYMAMGLDIANEVDPVLATREPDDIHLDMEL